jgi:hypothetical protein
MMLDVGSNLGYFGVRAALANSELAVVSLEAQHECAALQAKVLASHRLTRVCLIQGMLNSASVEAWSRRTDWFDLTLMLSIVHWFDDPVAVVGRLSQMSGTMIAEMVDPLDSGACGQERIRAIGDPVEWLKRVTRRNCELIGRCRRHTSEHASHLVRVSGPTDVNFRPTFWDHRIANDEATEPAIYFDGSAFRWKQGNSIIPYRDGANLASLLKLGRLVYPTPKHIIGCANSSAAEMNCAPDLLTRNVIWSGRGLEILSNADVAAASVDLVWRVGGVVKEDEKAKRVQALRQKACLRQFRSTMYAWARNETVDPNSSSFEPSSRARAWAGLKRFVRRILPKTWVLAIRRTVHGT